MKVFSQLEKAQLENTTSDTGSLPKGMITYRTDLNIAKVSNGTSMLALIDESSTQTLSGKTYASPNFTGAFNMAQTTTPANPSAGNNKFYFKADGKLYTLDSSGNEALVGSGTGGVKNLITNGNADDTAASIFVPYADTGTRPVDGTGGSPTVTTSISSSTPLDGVKSFLLTKPASNVQGQGWAVPFTVDPAYRAKSLKISVDYIVNSGTFVAGGAGVESDVIWYIYDVTNSQLIEPSNIKMFSNSSSLTDKFEATFQSSATGSSYRLIAHVQSTSALAYELKVDNITVSPQSYVFGSPITDWIAYTPTISGTTTAPTKGTTTVDVAKWRRVGDSMEITYTYRQTSAGSGGSGNYLISLPPGFTIDSSKINVGWAAAGNAGTFAVSGTVSGQNGTGIAYCYTTTQLAFIYTPDSNGAYAGWGSASGGFTNTDMDFSFHVMVPILGWSSSVQTSDNADTRVVAARVVQGNAQSIPNNSLTVATFNAPSLDTHGAATTNYRIPVSGIYRFIAANSFPANATGIRVNVIQISTNDGGSWGDVATGSTGGLASGQSTIFTEITRQFNAGDLVRVSLFQNSGGSLSTVSDGTQNYLSVERLSGPSAIAASENVNARYTSSAGQSIPSGAFTIVNFGTKVFDSHNAVTTGGSWRFTAPISGTYSVAAMVLYASASWNDGEHINIRLFKKGSAYAELARYETTATGTQLHAGSGATAQVKLLAGEYVDIQTAHVNAASRSLINDGLFVWVDINKTGNY